MCVCLVCVCVCVCVCASTFRPFRIPRRSPSFDTRSPTASSPLAALYHQTQAKNQSTITHTYIHTHKQRCVCVLCALCFVLCVCVCVCALCVCLVCVLCVCVCALCVCVDVRGVKHCSATRTCLVMSEHVRTQFHRCLTTVRL